MSVTAFIFAVATTIAQTNTATVATSTAAEEEETVIELVDDSASPDAHDVARDDAFSTAIEGIRSARSSIKLEGRASIDTRFDRTEEHVATFGLGGQLEVEIELGPRLTVFAAPSFFYQGGFQKDGSDREALYLETPEAWVQTSFGPVDLRAGALVFSWGASDLIAPNDVLNPLDYRRNFVAGIDDAKIPVIAAEVITTFGPLNVRGVVEPFFTPSRFFLAGWDTSLLQSSLMQGFNAPSLESLLGQPTVDAIGDQLLISERPSVRPDNATLALRAKLTIDDLDLAVTAVHGWEPLPQVRVNPDLVSITSVIADAVAQRRPINIDQELFAEIGRLQEALQRGEALFYGRYERRDLIGFDAVLAIDPFILKVDTAYSFSRTAYTQTYEPVTQPWLNTVVGAEYVDGDDLQVIVEAFMLTIIGVRSHYRLAFFEPRAPPPSMNDVGARTISVAGLAGVVRYAILDGDLRFELGGVATLSRGDAILIPAIRYRLDDAQQVSLGATVIEGRDDGYGGAYTQNDEVFIHYQWTH